MRTLRHPETSTLSFVSAITLCIRSDCFSLTARAPESSLCLSRWTAVPRRLLSGLHANYCNQTQVILILHLTHLLTAVSWVFLPLQTSLNHAPLATHTLCLISQGDGIHYPVGHPLLGDGIPFLPASVTDKELVWGPEALRPVNVVSQCSDGTKQSQGWVCLLRGQRLQAHHLV